MKSVHAVVLTLGWMAMSAFGLGGCASTYAPQDTKRISMTLESGHFVLRKEGKSYSAGGLSMEPVEAVRGNAVAEEYARTYVHRGRAFWALYGIGLGSLVAGIVTNPYTAMGHDTRRDISAGLTLGGLAAFGAALVFASTMHHNLYDAVNSYNDGLSSQMP